MGTDDLIQGIRSGRIKPMPASDFAPQQTAEATAHMAEALAEIREAQVKSAHLARRRHLHMMIAMWVAAFAALGAFVVGLVALLR